MFYIYEIRNLINNKQYIGFTNNWKRRQGRHFQDLKGGVHDNPHLQKAYYKYGRDSFEFNVLAEYDCSREEISQYEIEWIKKTNSYLEGYNCNRGGLEHNGFEGKLKREEIYNILSALEFTSRPGARLAEIFECSVKSISRIKNRESYSEYYDEYYKLTNESRKKLYEDFERDYDFNYRIKTSQSLNSKRRFTEEQIFIILIRNEFHLNSEITLGELKENFGFSSHNTIYSIEMGKTYQDYLIKYNNLDLDTKKKILCHYTEMYSSKPLELLETPNVEVEDNQQLSH